MRRRRPTSRIARQKRDKAQYDVAETERIIASLTLRAPAAGTISLMPNFRAGGPFTRAAPEFRRGDRAWFGAPIAELPDLSAVQMTCRVDEADRARVQPARAVRVRVDAIPDRELPALDPRYLRGRASPISRRFRRCATSTSSSR